MKYVLFFLPSCLRFFRGIVGVRTLHDIENLVVEDASAQEVEDLKWYKRPLLNDQVVQLENFAPLKSKRYYIFCIPFVFSLNDC